MADPNRLLKHLSHDYILVAAAAVVFFAVKAWIGYRTYRHYDKRLKALEALLKEALSMRDKQGG